MHEIIKYDTYEKLAEKYIIEKYGSLDVIKTDLILRDEVSNYMLKLTRHYCGPTPQDILAAGTENRKHFQRFIERHMDL